MLLNKGRLKAATESSHLEGVLPCKVCGLMLPSPICPACDAASGVAAEQDVEAIALGCFCQSPCGEPTMQAHSPCSTVPKDC